MSRRVSPALLSSFLSVEGAVYACFLVLDLMGQGDQTTFLKYAGILLCLAFSLLGGDRLVPLALALTAVAGPGRTAPGPCAPPWPWGRDWGYTPSAWPRR